MAPTGEAICQWCSPAGEGQGVWGTRVTTLVTPSPVQPRGLAIVNRQGLISSLLTGTGAGGGCWHGGQPPLAPYVHPVEIILQAPFAHSNAERLSKWDGGAGWLHMGQDLFAHIPGMVMVMARHLREQFNALSGHARVLNVLLVQGRFPPPWNGRFHPTLWEQGPGDAQLEITWPLLPLGHPKHLCEAALLQYPWVDDCQEGRLHPNTEDSQRVAPTF